MRMQDPAESSSVAYRKICRLHGTESADVPVNRLSLGLVVVGESHIKGKESTTAGGWGYRQPSASLCTNDIRGNRGRTDTNLQCSNTTPTFHGSDDNPILGVEVKKWI